MIPQSPGLFGFAVLALAGPLRAADTPPPAATSTAAARGGRGVSLDETFALLDRDHDGKISKAEATGAYAQRFTAWDADGDGFATRQEVHDYRLRFGLDDSGRRIAPTAPAATQRTAPRAAASAALLKEPADWRLETMALPPGFAPQVKLKGTEEIRFAPGMFEPASRTYFTCALALVVDGTTELGAAELRDFLEKYYRGLSAGRASRSGVTPNPAQTQAEVQAVEGAKNRFTAQVGFFDTFSDGRRILLHVEAAVLPAAARKQTTVILLVSPSAKESGVWPALREIGRKGEKNVPSEP